MVSFLGVLSTCGKVPLLIPKIPLIILLSSGCFLAISVILKTGDDHEMVGFLGVLLTSLGIVCAPLGVRLGW